jgi:hypothetical protein
MQVPNVTGKWFVYVVEVEVEMGMGVSQSLARLSNNRMINADD